MDVVSVSTLRATSLVWQPRPSTWVLTVVAKVTYALRPGEAVLAPEQEAPTEDDDHWDDNPARSVRVPSDLAPVKPRVEVVLVGNAFAPDRVPVRSLVARLVVGDFEKSVEVFGDRLLGPDGAVQEGARFARMPLVYERAAGGPGTWNPTGVRADARDASGRRILPNLQAPGARVTSMDAALEPAGFGPLAPAWPTRAEKLGRHAAAFATRQWRERPLPDGIDFGYFNIAPADQQIAAIRGDERILLENLSPEHPRLTTALPGVRPAAFVDSDRGAASRLAMRADTLWIDTDQAIATLTWRGQIPLERPDEEGEIVIGLDQPGKELSWDELEDLRGPRVTLIDIPPHVDDAPLAAAPRAMFKEERSEGTFVGMSPIPRAAPGALPFAGGAPPRAAGGAPPFAGKAPPFASSAAAPPDSAPQPESATGLRKGLPFQFAPPAQETRPTNPGGGLPFQAPGSPASSSASWPKVAPPPPPVPAPPAAAGGREPLPTVAWIAPPAPASSPPPPASAPPAPAPVSAPAIAPPPVSSPPLGLSARDLAPREVLSMAAVAAVAAAPSAVEGGQKGSVLASSNAAAAAHAVPWSPPRRNLRAVRPELEPLSDAGSGARELVQLVWYEPEAAPRIRRVERWKPVLDALEQRPPDRAIDALAAASKDPLEAEDMREIFEIVARGGRTDALGVSEALEGAIQDDGKFLPPLVLVAGEIEAPFDELEALKAAVAAASPVAAATDEALKAALTSARDLLQSSPPPPPSVAEAATTRVRDAFVREKKSLAPDHLDVQMERLLLVGRHYQKREVLGGSFLRMLLWMPDDLSPLLAYLPADLAKKLPMYRRWRARILAEVHPAQDQYEMQPHALRALALARGQGPRQ